MDNPHTVADYGQLFKDLEALEARVTTQDLQLVHNVQRRKKAEAQLFKTETQLQIATERLQKVLDLLDRIRTSHRTSNGCTLSPYFEAELQRTLEDYQGNKHTQPERGYQEA